MAEEEDAVYTTVPLDKFDIAIVVTDKGLLLCTVFAGDDDLFRPCGPFKDLQTAYLALRMRGFEVLE